MGTGMKGKNTMNRQQTEILRDIVHRMMARYMTIRPLGIDLGNSTKLIPVLNCRVLNYSAARTLYHQRRPICRSLDAVKTLSDSKKHCQQCPDRKHCTGQVRLDLLFENCPYRLLIAYTSAKNFLLYTGKLVEQKLEIQTIDTKIIVVNRGSWGELRFFRADR
jgi:hypothetical protein